MLLSIIVPLYNCENEIKRCLTSIIDNIENCNNHRNEIELIIVNDGSTDRSLNIAESAALPYSYIKIISQNNKGISGARNSGMDVAVGKYIWFIDGDDYITPDTISNLLEIILHNDLEILSFSFIHGSDDALSKHQIKQNFNNISDIISGEEYIAKYQYSPYAWAYIFKKQLATDNNIHFMVGRTMEDTMFTTPLFLMATRFATVDAECYYYVIRENSITQNQSIAHQNKLINDYIFVAQYLTKILTQINIEGRHFARIEDRRNSFIFFTLIKVLRYSPKRIDDIIAILQNNGLYPFKQLCPNNYPDIKYRILCWCMNRQYIWKGLCKLKSILKK